MCLNIEHHDAAKNDDHVGNKDFLIYGQRNNIKFVETSRIRPACKLLQQMFRDR